MREETRYNAKGYPMTPVTDIRAADQRSLRELLAPIANRELWIRLFYMSASFATLLFIWYEVYKPYPHELTYWQAMEFSSICVASYVIADGLLRVTRQSVWGGLFRPYEAALAQALSIPEYRALAEGALNRTVTLYDDSDDEGNALNWILIEPVLRRALADA